MDRYELSVVIPAYNEEAVIGSTIDAVARYCAANGVRYEMLVVDDGSADRTVAIANARAEHVSALRVLANPHHGKGSAVWRGLREAHGIYAVFLDADLSTPVEEWEKFAPWLRNGYDVVIGSRKMPGADVRRRQPALRAAMGKIFTWLTNRLLGMHVTDVTCGFKAFRTEAARAIGSLQRIHGWAFDAELLFLAQRLGYRVKEIPVRWTNDASTNVRLAPDAMGSLKELLAIRIAAWRGLYARPLQTPTTNDELSMTEPVTGKW